MNECSALKKVDDSLALNDVGPLGFFFRIREQITASDECCFRLKEYLRTIIIHCLFKSIHLKLKMHCKRYILREPI